VIEGKTPEEGHEGWLRIKEKEGWVYGPVKDTVAKTHPCMLPYNELPADQRFKDTLFSLAVKTAAFDMICSSDNTRAMSIKANSFDAISSLVDEARKGL